MWRSSTLQFPDSYVFNHRIIIASFVEKGSPTRQAIRQLTDGFFFAYQWVRIAASFWYNQSNIFQLIIVKPFSLISV
jgi:hypothetical protein